MPPLWISASDRMRSDYWIDTAVSNSKAGSNLTPGTVGLWFDKSDLLGDDGMRGTRTLIPLRPSRRWMYSYELPCFWMSRIFLETFNDYTEDVSHFRIGRPHVRDFKVQDSGAYFLFGGGVRIITYMMV